MAQVLRPTGEGASYYSAANYGYATEFDEYVKTLTFAPGRGSVTGRILLEGKAVQIPDVLADPEYNLSEAQRVGGFRTHLGVPLLREGSLIGVIVLSRTEVRPFTDKHIELVTTFADQAVIAIENVRLFDEVQARTRDLSESLQQQTATADVLKVISSSPGELEPVFQTMLAKATELCEAELWHTLAKRRQRIPHCCPSWRSTERLDRTLAQRNPIPTRVGCTAGTRRRGAPADPGRGLANDPSLPRRRSVASNRGRDRRHSHPACRADVQGERICRRDCHLSKGSASVHRQANRTGLELRRPGRHRHRKHAPAQRIAQRTRSAESLQQQTATADVLKVISRSTFDLQAVLDTLVESAARLCEADMVSVTRPKGTGDAHYHVASFGFPPTWVEFMQTYLLAPERGTLIGRTLLERRISTHSRRIGRPGILCEQGARNRRISHGPRRSDAARRDRDRRVHDRAPHRRVRSPTSRSSS